MTFEQFMASPLWLALAGAVVAGVPVAAVGAVTAGTVGAGFGAGVGVGQ